MIAYREWEAEHTHRMAGKVGLTEAEYLRTSFPGVNSDPPAEDVPSQPPLIVIEVLSPDVRMPDALAKFQEYVASGVPHVWLIDPRTRQLSIYDRQGLLHVDKFPVPEANRPLRVADIFD